MTGRFERIVGRLALGAAGLVALAVPAAAQVEDELLLEGVPMENSVVGHDMALRLRAEVQLTEEDELLREDIGYAQFPSRMGSVEAKLYMRDRSRLSLVCSQWQNAQGLDQRQWTWNARVPVNVVDIYNTAGAAYLTMKFRLQEADETVGTAQRSYGYLALDKTYENGVYSYLQYRLAGEPAEPIEHQVSEYVSWRASRRWRVGGQAAASTDDGQAELGPWYLRLFGAVFLVEDRTALRLDAQHYDVPASSFQFQECNAYLYQQIGKRSLLRLAYRFYTDSSDLSSQAYGIKAKHFFTSRISAHLGYRYYDHAEGADFNTFYGGFGLLL